MQCIESVIQGSVTTLFNRVYEELRKCDASKKTLAEYERHRNDPIEELMEISYDLLLSLDCWSDKKK